ncbi:hypothetical protein ACJX0J_016431, partial [Zea mays]
VWHLVWVVLHVAIHILFGLILVSLFLADVWSNVPVFSFTELANYFKFYKGMISTNFTLYVLPTKFNIFFHIVILQNKF